MKKILATMLFAASTLGTLGTLTLPAAHAQAGAAKPAEVTPIAMPTTETVRTPPPAPAPAVAPAPAPQPAGGLAGSWPYILGAVLVLGAGLLIYRMGSGKDTPATPATAARKAPGSAGGAASGFDSAAFLREAKASFIRMQAAWDKADTADLSTFTTPQIFAELSSQLQQRGPTGAVTEVVTIESELLGVEVVGADMLGSVKFTGTIKTAATAPAEPFAEVWNLSRPLKGGGGWMIAGIKQLA